MNRRLSEYASTRSYLAAEHGVEIYGEAWRRLGNLINQRDELTVQVRELTAAITATWPRLPGEPGLAEELGV